MRFFKDMRKGKKKREITGSAFRPSSGGIWTGPARSHRGRRAMTCCPLPSWARTSGRPPPSNRPWIRSRNSHFPLLSRRLCLPITGIRTIHPWGYRIHTHSARWARPEDLFHLIRCRTIASKPAFKINFLKDFFLVCGIFFLTWGSIDGDKNDSYERLEIMCLNIITLLFSKINL